MFKKGFISSTFLIIFLILVSFVVVVEYQSIKTMTIIENINESNRRFIIEKSIVDFINCELINERLESLYILDMYNLNIDIYDDQLIVYCSLLPYILTMEYENNKIVDYY